MTFIDFALLFFVGVNALRILAYGSQIATIARDHGGATAISLTTWTLFTASHLSTAIYALASADDWTIAAVFFLNGVCSLAIVALTMTKRRQTARPRQTADARAI